MTAVEQGAKAPLSVGQRVLVRDQEWLVTKIEGYTIGYEGQEQNKEWSARQSRKAVTCVGISPLVRDYQATFLDDLDTIEPVDPTKTVFVADNSPHAQDSHLFLESMLRSTVPTDNAIHVAQGAAMDRLPYQFKPAEQALAQPRQRILIADAVGLGKTLEAGILMSELIRRHKGQRILVVTSKAMMAQFQREMWEHFTIPLTSLDSSRIQRIRADIPANANPFNYYDKVIVSVDTLKRDIQYGAALDDSYWDIIVIDEAQNVADRGNDRKRAQRAKLAQRLANRSDTLIMLSATPHDGRAKSFASLMNMLDPTTLPDPDNYTKEDIRQLYIRRFKKDVAADVSGNFPERRVTQEKCRTSRAEEDAFDCLVGLHLKMDARRRSNDALFRTMLEKSLFSSPAACIKTIDERLKKLRHTDPGDATGDQLQLEELRARVQDITPDRFTRYQRLLDLLRSQDYGWDPTDTRDRVVIFSERIETAKFLETHLRKDLDLPRDAIVQMDGSMVDTEQQQVVQEFNDPKSPVRVLVASDVASEGLNLHKLSHRLIHFDTPWSLMVFQQRNGRIDRYGQTATPDIRFMLIDPVNDRIRGDVRILEVLADKERQARDNIGDPALLMGKFDVEEEVKVTAAAIESGQDAEQFDRSLDMTHLDVDDADADDFSDWFSDEVADDAAPAESAFSADDSALGLMDDYEYVREGLQRFKEAAGIERVEELGDGVTGLAVQFTPDSLLHRWLRRHVPDPDVVRGDHAEWTTDKDYLQARSNPLIASLADRHWSRTQYLWALNPIVEWVGQKASSLLYGRAQAPIVAVRSRHLDSHDLIILVTGSIANNHAVPVIDEWIGLHYRDGRFVEALSLDETWKRTGFRGSLIPGTERRQYVNAGDIIDPQRLEQACALLPDAVAQATAMLREARDGYRQRTERQVDEQLDRIDQWERKRKSVNGESAAKANQEVDRITGEYAKWVRDSYDTQNEPVIRIAAAFTGVDQ